jgi:glycosyltransferase involved in cell wall biosynthesis
MHIHQVVVGASPGDAITNYALSIRDVLRRFATSDIYASHIHRDLSGNVLPLAAYGRVSRRRPYYDVLIFHASIGDPGIESFLSERPERIVLCYHNISPAAPFLPYDPLFAGLLEEGRRHLVHLRSRAVLAIGASAFNADELVQIGYRNVKVAPLIVDLDRLHGAKGRNKDLANHGPMYLAVGQLLPHKRPEYVIQAFHILSTYMVPDASLVLVGPSRLPRFRSVIDRLIRELKLDRVLVTGQVPTSELAEYYRNADVFVSSSEHEGFCVPLLEAMSFDVPVVARRFAAVPETLGGAGVLLDPDDPPSVAAEALAALSSDQGIRDELIQRGRRRTADFAPEQSIAQFLDHLLTVV